MAAAPRRRPRAGSGFQARRLAMLVLFEEEFRPDEAAVANHQSVLYVLGPPQSPDKAGMCSIGALFLVDALIKSGAVAAKGESAGVAHGLARWGELTRAGAAAMQADDHGAILRAGRLAFAKRPLASDVYTETVGFHLVGLPEVYVAKAYGSEREVAAVMDQANYWR